MINKIILVGRTGSDPEVKVLNGGKKVAKISLATSESFKTPEGKKEVTEWHNLVIWNQLAEVVEKWVHKGDQLYIEGSIHYQSYEKDGVKKTSTNINVYTLKMLGGQRKEENPRAEEPKGAEHSNLEAPTPEDDMPF